MQRRIDFRAGHPFAKLATRERKSNQEFDSQELPEFRSYRIGEVSYGERSSQIPLEKHFDSRKASELSHPQNSATPVTPELLNPSPYLFENWNRLRAPG